MALLNAYDPCPCGSGQKYKWCCFQAATFIDRILRYRSNDQHDACAKVTEEGLAKFPDNAYLLIQQAVSLVNRGASPDAMLDRLLTIQPNHPYGLGLRLITRYLRSVEHPEHLLDDIGVALRTLTAENCDAYAPFLSRFCDSSNNPVEEVSCLKLIRIAMKKWEPNSEVHIKFLKQLHQLLVEFSPTPWIQHDHTLLEPGEDLSAAERGRFLQAIADAQDANFRAAASVFDEIAESHPSAEVYWNAALVKFWMMDVRGGATALARCMERLEPESEAAVDAEALLRSINYLGEEYFIEHVFLSWPIRDRSRLIAILDGDRSFVKIDGSVEEKNQKLKDLIKQFQSPDDAGDRDEVDERDLKTAYVWFDRPVNDLDSFAKSSRADAPTLYSLVFVDRDKVGLRTIDDERLVSEIDRFREIAGSAIAPAQPRTTTISKIGLILTSEYFFTLIRLLTRENEPLNRWNWAVEKYIAAAWAPLVLEKIVGRRPKSLADLDPRSRRVLRAMFCILEQSFQFLNVDWDLIRDDAGVPREPAIDPAALDKDSIESIPIYKLIRVDVKGLDDEALIAFEWKAQRFAAMISIRRAVEEIFRREGPNFPAELKAGHATLMSRIQLSFGTREDLDAFFDRCDSVHYEDPDDERYFRNCVEILRISVAIRENRLATAMPDLLAMMDRIGDSRRTSAFLLDEMIQLGLMRLVRNPKTQEIELDPTRLMEVAAPYAPLVAESSVGIDVAAGRKTIWTPGSDDVATGERKAIWTPGSSLR